MLKLHRRRDWRTRVIVNFKGANPMTVKELINRLNNLIKDYDCENYNVAIYDNGRWSDLTEANMSILQDTTELVIEI